MMNLISYWNYETRNYKPSEKTNLGNNEPLEIRTLGITKVQQRFSEQRSLKLTNLFVNENREEKRRERKMS